MNKKRNTKFWLNLVLTLVIILAAYLVLQNSLLAIFKRVLATNGWLILLLLSLESLNLYFEGRNVQLLSQTYNQKFTIRDGLLSHVYGTFYRAITFGTGTLPSKVAFLKRKELTSSESIAVLFIHMMFYKLALLVMGLVMVLFYLPLFIKQTVYLLPLTIYGLVATGLVVLLLYLLATSGKFHNLLFKWAHFFLKKSRWADLLTNRQAELVNLRQTVRHVMGERRLVIQLLFLNLCKLLPWYVIPYVVLKGDANISLTLSFTLIALTTLIAGVLPSPGGIGSFELLYLLFFGGLVGNVLAGSSLILYRFATYAVPFLLGLIYTINYRRLKLQAEIQQEEN